MEGWTEGQTVPAIAGGPKKTFKMLSVDKIHSRIVYNTAR